MAAVSEHSYWKSDPGVSVQAVSKQGLHYFVCLHNMLQICEQCLGMNDLDTTNSTLVLIQCSVLTIQLCEGGCFRLAVAFWCFPSKTFPPHLAPSLPVHPTTFAGNDCGGPMTMTRRAFCNNCTVLIYSLRCVVPLQ